jgi:hypothetical protein
MRSIVFIRTENRQRFEQILAISSKIELLANQLSR